MAARPNLDSPTSSWSWSKGLPITDYCETYRLNVVERLSLFCTVCEAVHHAHLKGIIHRDLKPSNVLVPRIDGNPIPKVIDFGVAKTVNAKLTDATLYTQFSQLIGSPLYMSPEQAELGVVDIDTRSDVYSLGVLLYELLTGCTPLDRETVSKAGFDEMRRMIREDDPPTPSLRLRSGDTSSTSSGSKNQIASGPTNHSATCGDRLDRDGKRSIKTVLVGISRLPRWLKTYNIF